MKTMNLVTTASTAIAPEIRTADITLLESQELEAWFGEAGLAVTEVAHCASASCPICFRHEVEVAARAA